MYEQKVEELADRILRQSLAFFSWSKESEFTDEMSLNEIPIGKVDALSRASRVICSEGFGFEALVDTSTDIYQLKYRVFRN